MTTSTSSTYSAPASLDTIRARAVHYAGEIIRVHPGVRVEVLELHHRRWRARWTTVCISVTSPSDDFLTSHAWSVKNPPRSAAPAAPGKRRNRRRRVPFNPGSILALVVVVAIMVVVALP